MFLKGMKNRLPLIFFFNMTDHLDDADTDLLNFLTILCF